MYEFHTVQKPLPFFSAGTRVTSMLKSSSSNDTDANNGCCTKMAEEAKKSASSGHCFTYWFGLAIRVCGVLFVVKNVAFQESEVMLVRFT